MIFMKKHISLILLAAILMTQISCGEAGNADSETTTGQTETTAQPTFEDKRQAITPHEKSIDPPCAEIFLF